MAPASREVPVSADPVSAPASDIVGMQCAIGSGSVAKQAHSGKDMSLIAFVQDVEAVPRKNFVS